MSYPDHYNDLKDPENFRALYREYYPGLIVYAKEYQITAAEAEDIVQDIFVALWENKNASDISGIKTYLFRATRNGCLNYLSKLKVRTRYQNTALKLQNAPDALAEDFYVVADLERLLNETIGKLPSQRQKVFTMSRFEGKPVSEIAQLMNISPRTVEKHLQLSLAELRGHMAPYMPLAALLISEFL